MDFAFDESASGKVAVKGIGVSTVHKEKLAGRLHCLQVCTVKKTPHNLERSEYPIGNVFDDSPERYK